MTSMSTIKPAKPDIDWVYSKECAALLGFKYRYFTEEFIFTATDFPKAYIFTPGGRRKWDRAEIHAWMATRREAA